MPLGKRTAAVAAASLIAILLTATATAQEKTQKPPLHGSHWMAITGKPLAATAGATTWPAKTQDKRELAPRRLAPWYW